MASSSYSQRKNKEVRNAESRRRYEERVKHIEEEISKATIVPSDETEDQRKEREEQISKLKEQLSLQRTAYAMSTMVVRKRKSRRNRQSRRKSNRRSRRNSH